MARTRAQVERFESTYGALRAITEAAPKNCPDLDAMLVRDIRAHAEGLGIDLTGLRTRLRLTDAVEYWYEDQPMVPLYDAIAVGALVLGGATLVAAQATVAAERARQEAAEAATA